MQISVLGTARDVRTGTSVIYAKAGIHDYLELVGTGFADFEIQRRREKHRAYRRMRDDILQGALLPTITLAVSHERVPELLALMAQDQRLLERALAQAGTVHILDGLQRTYILKELADQGAHFAPEQTLLLEFWLETSIRNLIYRIIVLNAGQKPMSLRHQVELLFLTIRDQLERNIPDLELTTERETGRRTRPRRFALDRVATAYYSFLTRSPEVQRENVVTQTLVDGSIFEESEGELAEKFASFESYLKIYSELDDEIFRVYSRDASGAGSTGFSWFGSANVMNSFFAAVADFGITPERSERIRRALARLKDLLAQSQDGDDPLALKVLNEISAGFPVRKTNVGYATRKLLAAGFKEFFREQGELSFEQCWINEG